MGNNGYIAASGASVQQRELDVIANNLANVGTPGFKRSESIFRSALESSLRNPEGRSQPGAPASSFVATAGVGTDFGNGPAMRTGSGLHAAIEGPGFFEVETPAGLRYTRGGNFVINREGQLAMPSGEPVMGDGGPITIPGGHAEIQPNGVLEDAEGNVLGRLPLHDFERLASLEREGLGFYRAGEGSGQRLVEEPRLIPGSVEGSNVEAARELATLVMIQRAFETNLRAMQVDDESTQQLIEGMR